MKGKCYCGALKYEISGDALMKAQCHCRECQYVSGGGPNFFMLIPQAAITYTEGTPAEFRRSDLENPVTRQFCGACGTQIASLLPGRPLAALKIGTLDNPAEDFGGPRVAIYTKDSQPFHVTAEGLPCFEGLPPQA